jgi:hypothetical protein
MQIWLRVTALALVCLAGVVRAAPPQRGENLVVNAGFEAGAASWQEMGKGFTIDDTVAHSGAASLRCVGTTLTDTHGARQVITFDPPLQHPFRVSGWAKAENADVARDFDVFLDLHYADGTPLWGQIARFEPGTHDWQYSEWLFDVSKPVKTIEVHVLFRQAKGTAWFDDIRVELTPFAFRHERLWAGAYGGASLLYSGNTSLPAAWTATVSGPQGTVFETAAASMPVRVDWRAALGAGPVPRIDTLRVVAKDSLRGETLEKVYPLALDANPAARAYAVWTESSMRRVLPTSLPETTPVRTEARITLAANEYESFQVVVLPLAGGELRNLRVEVSELVSADGKSRIGKDHIEWQQVGYVRIEKVWPHPAYPEAVAGWWPDPLLPVESVSIPAGFAQPLWVTVYAPPGTPAGEYTGTVTIRPPGQPATEVAVHLTVYGLTLPTQGHLKTAFALMDGYLEKLYGKPLTPALRQAYGDFVLRHRLNPDDISRTAPPALEDLHHYRDRGLNAFNLLNLVEERGARIWVCWSPEKVYTPAFKQRLIERLDPYVATLRREGLAGRAYIYTFDERGKEFFPIIREYFGMVKERYPEIPTLTTAYVPQDPVVMRDLRVDWNCPVSSVYRFEQAEACRAAGLQVWSYICMGPRYPYANWLADDPLIEARLIWWQAYHQKLDGFLYWGLNIWERRNNDQPIDPAAGPLLQWSITTGAPGSDWERLHGDGELLYAGVAGPLGSIRLANLRDGLEDYEYLWLLGQSAAGVEAARTACLPVTTSLTQFCRDPAVLTAQRETIARRLETAGAVPR